MSSDLLKSLSDVQQQAATHVQGPCMVIAGAGSGKTRVLTHRIAHLIERHEIDPFSILALTFTNKSAKEMQARIASLLGSHVRSLWIGTFHALFARILRKEASLLGYTSAFTIYDKADSVALAKSILKEHNIPEEKCKPQQLLYHIAYAKRELITWNSYVQDKNDHAVPIGPLYKCYVERCYKANAMDFDDLLFNTYLLFEKHTEVLARYQARFKYLLIDEFQDTNRAQYLIAQKLSAPEDNIFVVGDDAQSIYSFRGADIGHILHFQQTYSAATLIRLEQNYRSTNNITLAAQSLIAKNKEQITKKIWTANPAGSPIGLLQAQTDNEEGRLVATTIFEQKYNFGCKNSEIAILYRTHSQSRAMEEALRRLQLPYRIYGGVAFYERKEVKDVLAYLRFLLNPMDEVSLQRIINMPKRGIGDTTLQRLREVAADHDLFLWEALQAADKLLDKRSCKLFLPFIQLITQLQAVLAGTNDVYAFVQQVAQDTGLLHMYYVDRTPEGVSRYENVQELLGAVRTFEADPEREDTSLAAFLQEVSLIADVDQAEGPAQEVIQLMTIHTAKGLEFRVVFVVGLEEDLFPSYYAYKKKNGLEEERRLFYVAMTRAKERLFISYAKQRYQYGTLRACVPSRFLAEVDRSYFTQHINQTVRAGSMSAQATARTTRYLAQDGHRPLRKLSKDVHAPDNLMNLQVGMLVEHRLFGSGEVLRINQGNNPSANIRFSTHGEKTLLLQYARLKVLH